jgi:hypothetical protein
MEIQKMSLQTDGKNLFSGRMGEKKRNKILGYNATAVSILDVQA